MQCQQIHEHLSAYLDKELTAELSAAVRAHLDACPDCRAEAEELRATADLLGRLPVHAAPEHLAADVQREIERRAILQTEGAAEHVVSERMLPIRRVRLWPRALAVAATMLLAAGIGIFAYLGGPAHVPVSSPAVAPPAAGERTPEADDYHARAPVEEPAAVPPAALAKPSTSAPARAKPALAAARPFAAPSAPDVSATIPRPEGRDKAKMPETPAKPAKAAKKMGSDPLALARSENRPVPEAPPLPAAPMPTERMGRAPGSPESSPETGRKREEDQSHAAAMGPAVAQKKEKAAEAKESEINGNLRSGGGGRGMAEAEKPKAPPLADVRAPFTAIVPPATPAPAPAAAEPAVAAATPAFKVGKSAVTHAGGAAVTSGAIVAAPMQGPVAIQQMINGVVAGNAGVEQLGYVATRDNLRRTDRQIVIDASSVEEGDKRLVRLFIDNGWVSLSRANAAALNDESLQRAADGAVVREQVRVEPEDRQVDARRRKSAESQQLKGVYFLASQNGEDTWVVLTDGDSLSQFGAQLAQADGVTVAADTTSTDAPIAQLQTRLRQSGLGGRAGGGAVGQDVRARQWADSTAPAHGPEVEGTVDQVAHAPEAKPAAEREAKGAPGAKVGTPDKSGNGPGAGYVGQPLGKDHKGPAFGAETPAAPQVITQGGEEAIKEGIVASGGALRSAKPAEPRPGTAAGPEAPGRLAEKPAVRLTPETSDMTGVAGGTSQFGFDRKTRADMPAMSLNLGQKDEGGAVRRGLPTPAKQVLVVIRVRGMAADAASKAAPAVAKPAASDADRNAP